MTEKSKKRANDLIIEKIVNKKKTANFSNLICIKNLSKINQEKQA